MGIQTCAIHGTVGIAETCIHVARQIDVGEVSDVRRVAIINELLVCNGCFNSLGFQTFISLADLPKEELLDVADGRYEAFETAYLAIEGRTVACPRCVSQLQKHGSG
ncbi:MAG: hypothetical protein U1E53_31625 [Dongiaceae bacterium]